MIRRSCQKRLTQRRRWIASALKEFEDIIPDELYYISPSASLFGITTGHIGSCPAHKIVYDMREMKPGVALDTCRNTYIRPSGSVPLQNRRASRRRFGTRGSREGNANFLPLAELVENNIPLGDVVNVDEKPNVTKDSLEVSHLASPPSSPMLMQMRLPTNNTPVCIPDATPVERNDGYVGGGNIAETKDCSYYVNVHRLLDSVTSSGFSLAGAGDNKIQPSTYTIAATTQAGRKQAPLLPALRSSRENNRIDSVTSFAGKTELVPPRHPFLHFWEYGDDCVFARDWRPRRETYLTFHSMKCSLDTSVPNASRSISLHGTDNHSPQPKPSPKVVPIQKQRFSLLKSPCDDFVLSGSTDRSEFQPCLLGCRLPTDCDAFRGPTGFLRDDCELMVLWP